MTGDDEAARHAPDLTSNGSETRAAVAAEPVSPGEQSLEKPLPSTATPFPDTASPSQAPAVPDTEPSKSVSLAPVWAVLIVGLAVLAGAVLYLFSILPDPNRIAGAEKTVADLQAKIATLEAKPASSDAAGIAQRLDADEKRITELKTGLDAMHGQSAAVAPPGPAADVAPLAAKVADLDQTVGALRSSLPDTIKGATTALDDRLTALSSKVDGLPKIDLGPLTARVDAVDQRLAPIAAEYEAAKSPQRVTTMRENGSAADTRAAPLAVTADAVLRAIDAGRPFGEDVQVLSRLGADASLLAPLRGVADTGAPTVKDLRADLAAFKAQVGAQAAPTPTGSYLDRLMSGATSMVQVRPIGSVVGDTPPAVLARMDDALARDDLPAALADWQKLPEVDRDLGKSLAERIRLRQAAEDAARSIGARAIQAMASDQP